MLIERSELDGEPDQETIRLQKLAADKQKEEKMAQRRTERSRATRQK
jgi:hypothetical protein